jgi:hypothetical protein
MRRLSMMLFRWRRRDAGVWLPAASALRGVPDDELTFLQPRAANRWLAVEAD